jgi:hypothetical protein
MLCQKRKPARKSRSRLGFEKERSQLFLANAEEWAIGFSFAGLEKWRNAMWRTGQRRGQVGHRIQLKAISMLLRSRSFDLSQAFELIMTIHGRQNRNKETLKCLHCASDKKLGWVAVHRHEHKFDSSHEQVHGISCLTCTPIGKQACQYCLAVTFPCQINPVGCKALRHARGAMRF